MAGASVALDQKVLMGADEALPPTRRACLRSPPHLGGAGLDERAVELRHPCGRRTAARREGEDMAVDDIVVELGRLKAAAVLQASDVDALLLQEPTFGGHCDHHRHLNMMIKNEVISKLRG